MWTSAMHQHVSVLFLWLMCHHPLSLSLSLSPVSSRPSSLVSPFSLLPPFLLSFHSTGMKRSLEWKKYIRYPFIPPSLHPHRPAFQSQRHWRVMTWLQFFSITVKQLTVTLTTLDAVLRTARAVLVVETSVNHFSTVSNEITHFTRVHQIFLLF